MLEGLEGLDGFLCLETGHRMSPKLINMNISEKISISDRVDVAKGLYFELTEHLDIPGVKKSANNMELRFDGNDKNKLIALIMAIIT